MIYMDHAATTSTHPEVIRAMQPYFHDRFANPSGIYSIAKENRKVIEKSRQMIADTLHAKKDEIYFTAGGSEGDNWALKEIADAYSKKGRHIITTKLEHHGILHTCEYLEQHGFLVTYLDVDASGCVDPAQVEQAIRADTILISVMFANNEIGTIQPIGEIGAVARRHHILFHTDAVQACGQVPIHVKKDGISMLSASAHKFQGPKGVGFLYIQKDLPIRRFLEGGGQERGVRAGTENVPGIIGMGKALELAVASMERRQKQETYLRDYLMQRIIREIPYSRINGHQWFRLPNHVSVAFRFLNSASLLVMLDMEHIYASGGSACNTGDPEPSHVIQAIQVPKEYQEGVIRFTLGAENTKQEIDHVVEVLKQKVAELRKQSPEYEDYQKRES